MPSMLTWPVYPRLAQEWCVLYLNPSAPLLSFLFVPSPIIDIQLLYEKSYLFNGFFSSQNLNGILWVYNANCIIYKFCCFKISILNI